MLQGLGATAEVYENEADDPAIVFGPSGAEDFAIAAGGRHNGTPGERPHYHPGYYAAFVVDPDGNNIEAVFHDR